MSVILALLVAVLFGVGTYLLLQRTLTRVIIGLGLLGHAANLLLLLSGGRAGRAPFVDERGPQGDETDPLPHALALTAIVITFGITVFLLAMAYRSWQLSRSDEVEDDLEDRRIARLRGETDVDLDELTVELDELEDDIPDRRPRSAWRLTGDFQAEGPGGAEGSDR